MISNLFCINCYAVSNSDISLPPPLYTKIPIFASIILKVNFQPFLQYIYLTNIIQSPYHQMINVVLVFPSAFIYHSYTYYLFMLWSLLYIYNQLHVIQINYSIEGFPMLQGLDIELVVYILKLSAMRYLIWKCVMF